MKKVYGLVIMLVSLVLLITSLTNDNAIDKVNSFTNELNNVGVWITLITSVFIVFGLLIFILAENKKDDE